MKTVSVAFAVLLAISLAGCGGDGDEDGVSTGAVQVTTVDVQLQEQNFSGEAGTATLTAAGGKTRVAIVLASFAANAQPAHIHKGTCASLDPTPAYPLANIVQGRSTTVVDVSLETLLKGKYAINVHRSAKKLKVYVACGDISEHAAPAETVTSSEEND